MNIIKLAFCCALFSTLTACASIAGDNTRAVTVNSEPAGASIYMGNKQYGVTPSVITLPSDIYGGKMITVKKRGYQDQTAQVNTKFQPVALLDILLWPTLIIDGMTGNLVKIDPDNLNLNYKLQHA